MITDELLDFLRSQHAAGISKEEMAKLLLDEGGWTVEDINEGFRAAGLPHLVLPVAQPTPAPAPAPVVSPPSQLTQPTIASPIIQQPQPVQPPPVVQPGAPAVNSAPVVHEPTPPLPATPTFVPEVAPISSLATPQPEMLAPSPLQPLAMPQVEVTGKLAEAVHQTEAGLSKDESQGGDATTIDLSEPDDTLANISIEHPEPSGSLADISHDKMPTEQAGGGWSLQDLLAKDTLPQAQPTPKDVEDKKTTATPPPTEASVDASALPHFDLSRLEPGAPPLHPPPPIPPVRAPEPRVGPDGRMHLDIQGEAQRSSHAQSNDLNGVSLYAGDTAEQKHVETRPIQEVWAEATSHAATPPSTPPATFVPSGTIQRTRTMSSDLLLRGKGKQTPSIPAITVPADTADHIPKIKEDVKPEISAPQPAPVPQPVRKEIKREEKPVFDDPKKENIKRLLRIALIASIFLLVLGGGAFAFFTFGGSSNSRLFSSAVENFFTSTSFSYRGESSADLILSTATDGVARDGAVKFNTSYSGSLANSASGFGDGTHHATFAGELRSGTFMWGTNIESDIRSLANSLYFHVLAFPAGSDLDPDVLKLYWIKVDVAEIANELALSGVAAAQNGYGNFGGNTADNTVHALLAKYPPFSVGEDLGQVSKGGVMAVHVSLKSNPENFSQLVPALYRKYTSKDLVFTADQKVRFMNAVTKLKGEAWIDPKTGALLGISFNVDLDDDIVDVHVKGPFAFTVDLSDFNKALTVAAPSPMLTLEELRSRIDDYKKVKDLRIRDSARAENATVIQSALEEYKTQKGKYPTLLSELYSAKLLDAETISTTSIKEFYYAAYTKPDVLTKNGRCTQSGKTCDFYHLGVNFEDVNDPLLANDVDLTTDVRGNDSRGCGLETGVACYDTTSHQGQGDNTQTASSTVSTTP